jgi:hypothetical protein
MIPPTRRPTMTATAPQLQTRRELDHRHTNGIDVTLSWSPADDRLYVTVVDDAGDAFELVVGAHEALDAFQHPYAYAAHRETRLIHVVA